MGETVDELASPVTFTAATALDILRGVCESSGVGFGGAEVLQPPADNAMVLVPSVSLVARVGVDVSHRERLERELHAAAWLAEQGLLTPAPARVPPCPQLTEVQGRVVTWWQYVPSREHADLPQLMSALRLLHDLTPSNLHLARFDPWARIANQLHAATGLPETDQARLVRRWHALRSRWAQSRWPSEPAVVIHGDAHVLNTLVAPEGVYLLDLEDIRLGPWQWDAISPMIHLRAGWISPRAYREAIDAYGRDPSAEEEVELLVAIRLLRMTCWMASRSGREPGVVERVRRRIDYVEDPSLLARRPAGF
jgi:aminoglycoside phosphotransferase (APT) family kinase protein